MQKIFEDLTSPEWWFTVVIVAVLVGLVGVYLARFLDGTWRRLVAMRTNWTEAERLQGKKTVDYYMRNPHLLPFLMSDIQGKLTRATALALMAVSVLVGAMVALLNARATGARNAIPYPIFGMVFLGGIASGMMLRMMSRIKVDRGALAEIHRLLRDQSDKGRD